MVGGVLRRRQQQQVAFRTVNMMGRRWQRRKLNKIERENRRVRNFIIAKIST